MYEPETMPCKICGEPTTYLGTKMCNSCWEVSRRLARFVKSANGLKAVAAAMQQVHGGDNKDRNDDGQLRDLYVELDAVDIALANSMFRVETKTLNKRRAELLGNIKERERLWI